MAEEKLILKIEQIKENHEVLAAIIECLQEKGVCCIDVQEKEPSWMFGWSNEGLGKPSPYHHPPML